MAEGAPNFTMVPGSSINEPGFDMTAGSEAVHDLNSFGDATDPQQDRETKYPAGNSSAAGAVANFDNTIVGAGIIGLPFSMAQVRGASSSWCLSSQDQDGTAVPCIRTYSVLYTPEYHTT